jgi:hypothetical protein
MQLFGFLVLLFEELDDVLQVDLFLVGGEFEGFQLLGFVFEEDLCGRRDDLLEEGEEHRLLLGKHWAILEKRDVEQVELFHELLEGVVISNPQFILYFNDVLLKQ